MIQAALIFFGVMGFALAVDYAMGWWMRRMWTQEMRDEVESDLQMLEQVNRHMERNK